MTKRQLITIYSIIMFMMVWGFDLINAVKFKQDILLEDIVNPFNFSQIAYGILTFLFISWIFGRYYMAGKYWKLAAAIVSAFIFFIAVRYALEQVLYPILLNIRNYPSRTTIFYYILDNIYYAAIYIGFGVLLSLLDHQVGSQKKQALLLQKSREAELQFLRSQINPHFLFNTLNNIYSLVYEKSDKAPGAMLKLSGLLRYMLYEKREFIPLAKEWEYIHSFIELEKLRFDYEPNLSISTEGNMDNTEISPYLLIPFVENAFKHGDFKDPDFPLLIQMVVKENEIFFRAENKTNNRHKDQAGGVGLNNIKRRLELVYPGQHSLQITQVDTGFKVALAIKT